MQKNLLSYARNLRLSFGKVGMGFLFSLLPVFSFATHLMGGWAGYQYLGLQPSGNYRYQVTVKVYRFCNDQIGPCGNNACGTANLDGSIQLGAYTQDFLNPNDPNKVLAASSTIFLTSQSYVPLPGAAQCATAPVVCVEEGIYTDIIDLPPSNGGYHLIFERCCRNGQPPTPILNLANPGAAGMTFYAFVPPTFINNSSPTFALPPVPYICVNDTASILNTAFDPDAGDVVVYSSVQPYNGYADQFNPVPVPPNPYVFPIPLVTYAGGFSAAQPFGAGGYANVNAFTGISQYLSPATGNYVVAVELQEFRNNQLIGITRLDMQIIVVTCPPNNPPVLSSSTSQISYVANEGDSLCFPITFNDANGDSVFFSAIGNIFSNPPTNPPATITPNPNAGPGTVTSNFCWDLACNQTGNFFFIVQVPDNGCPPKITNVVYTIQVLPYNGPSIILGPTPVCENSSATYSVSASSGTSFAWTVAGGTISSGQGTNVITVNWGSAGNGTVDVTSFNVNGCPAGPITLNVTIQAIPVINAGPNSTICIGSSVNLTSGGGGAYSWSPSTYLNNTTISNPVSTPTVSTGYIVTVTSAIGCSNTDTVNITVNPQPIVNAGNNNTICLGFSTTIGGSPTGPAGSTYNWSPSTGLNNTTIANPTASPTATTTYTVIVTGVTTCVDTDFVTVTVNQPPIANAGIDIIVCPGINTTLNGTGGGTYNWSPSGSLSNPNISNPIASPTTSTTYTLVVTLNNCTDTDFVSVITLPLPAVSAGADVSICIGNSTTLNATGTGTFLWSPSTGLSCTTCTNPNANPTSTTSYTVTITDASACTNTDVVQVIINPLPLANAGPQPGWICPGFNTTLSASNGVTYVWSPSSSLSNPNISNPVASPTIITTYTVNITDANGCANWDTLTIFLNAAVPTNAGSDPTICIGQSTTIGGNPTSPSPNTTYQWFPSTGLNNSTLANPTASPTITTTYFIATASDTCNGSDSVTVFVNALPVVSAGADVSICTGNSTTLTASGGIIYSWSTTQTSTSISVAPTSASTYTVIGTDANGCSNIDFASVFVNALPIVSAGADVSICTGNSTTLTASGGTIYSWSTTQTSTSISVAPTSATTYSVIGTDANGCSNIDSASVFVNALPVVSAGADVSICTGNSTTLTASGGTIYSWSTTQTSTSISVAPTSATTYSVIGTDANGCSNIDSASVFVNALPVVSAGADVSICIGDASTLSGSGGQTFIWSPSATLNNPNISNPVANPTITTTYTLVATDGNTCSNTDTVNVTVNALPIVSAGADVSICIGDSTTLTGSGAQTFLWSPAGTLNNPNISNPVANPAITTTYTLVTTDGNTCSNTDTVNVTVNALPIVSAGADISICIGNSATLTASGANTYSWSTTQITTAIIVSPTSTSTYTVIGTDGNGCSNIDSASVFVNALPIVSAGADVSICLNDSTTLIGSGGTNYVWSPSSGLSNPNISNPNASPPATITYTLVTTDANTCSNTDTVNVTVMALPSVTTSNDTAICIGDSAFLSASGGIIYTWSPSSSLNNSTISNPIASPTITTTYTVTVTNSDGCTNTDSVKVTVNALPNIDAGANTILCPGDSVSLNASGGIIYVWTPSSGLSNPNIVNPNAHPSSATSYTVVGIDANGCVNLDSVSVSIGTIPTANFGYTLSLACEGMEAQFTDSSLNATAWDWDFGDGTSSALQNPSHSFPYNANYVITLTAINPPCSDTAQKTISLSDLSSYVSFTTSNVFTPNGDGINDCFNFIPTISGVDGGKFAGCAELSIYNRWGVPVYHSEYSGACWDGRTSTGIEVPAGTYFYMFDLNGIQLKGFVTVLR